jgi:hypothetical protein
MMASELTANCVDRNLSAKTIDWLAVEAVISELVSVVSFPCFAGKYREVHRIQPGDDD